MPWAARFVIDSWRQWAFVSAMSLSFDSGVTWLPDTREPSFSHRGAGEHGRQFEYAEGHGDLSAFSLRNLCREQW